MKVNKNTMNSNKRPPKNFNRKSSKHKNFVKKGPPDKATDFQTLEQVGKHGLKTNEDYTRLLLEPNVSWFEQKGTRGKVKTFSNISEVTALYEKDVANYRKKGEYRRCEWAIKKGTLGDKMDAYTVLLMDSVAHNLDGLDRLISMVTPKGKREAIMTLELLQNLLPSIVLPQGRKLVPFDQRDLSKPVNESQVLLWYVEDWIKNSYFHLLELLDQLSFDNVVISKIKALNLMADLLIRSPEEEQFLLAKLVNKLGDPENAVGSKVVFLLTKLLGAHPNMKLVVVKEVERLLYRPNITERAQLHCLCFLSQIVFSPGDNALARRLVTLYLRFFSALHQKSKNQKTNGGINSRLLKILLSGASRAFPFSKGEGGSGISQEDINALFTIVHQVHFNASVQALCLLFQVLDADDLVSDRFYRSLYKKLEDDSLQDASNISMFFSLLQKAIAKDKDPSRVRAFAKRILHVTYHMHLPHKPAALLLLSHLTKAHPNLLTNDQAPLLDVEEEKESGKYGWVYRPIKSSDHYDPAARDPRFANAHLTGMYELQLFAQDSHPSVVKFHEQLSSGIDYSGDAINDFTLTRFLDKMVYKNPKKAPEANLQNSIFGKRKLKSKTLGPSILPGTSDYLNKSKATIPPDELFLFDYLKQRQDHKKSPKANELIDDDEDEEEDILDKEFESYLGKHELDFGGAVLPLGEGGKKKKSRGDQEDDLESDEEEDDGLENPDDDEEIDFDDDESFNDAFKDFDFDNDEDPEALLEKELEEDEESDQDSAPRKKKRKVALPDIMNEDEFAEILESQSGKGTMANDLVNQDKADPKQLYWEEHRDRWMKGYSRSNKPRFNKKKFKR